MVGHTMKQKDLEFSSEWYLAVSTSRMRSAGGGTGDVHDAVALVVGADQSSFGMLISQ